MEEKLKANIVELVDMYIQLHKEKNRILCKHPGKQSDRQCAKGCDKCEQKYYGKMRYEMIKKYSS